jgi:hypothetical protein
MSAPLVIDAVGVYRRVAGPVIVSRGAGLADVVVIEDGGALNWFTGRLPAAVGTGWTGPVTEPSGVAFDAFPTTVMMEIYRRSTSSQCQCEKETVWESN